MTSDLTDLTATELGELWNRTYVEAAAPDPSWHDHIEAEMVRRALSPALADLGVDEVATLDSWLCQCADDQRPHVAAALCALEVWLLRWGQSRRIFELRGIVPGSAEYEQDEDVRVLYYRHHGVLRVESVGLDPTQEYFFPPDGDIGRFRARKVIPTPQPCAMCRRSMIDATPPLFLGYDDDLVCGRCVAVHQLTIWHRVEKRQ